MARSDQDPSPEPVQPGSADDGEWSVDTVTADVIADWRR
jgi:hypothetical protein